MRYCDNIRELDKVYTPREQGVIYEDEVRLVRKVLEIEKCTNEELCHLRNACVSYLSNEKGEDGRMTLDRMDKMSAIVHVIDMEKWNRGMEV